MPERFEEGRRLTAPLAPQLEAGSAITSDELLDRFLAYVAEKKLELYPAQEEAVLEVFAGNNVILSTPTGSGKSLVATAMHWKSLALGRRSFYTAPIKALVSEKFFALCKDFGPERVGMITGDASVNASAPIIACTAEILANRALRDGADAAVDDVIMDEFHYYGDRERGVAWQVPLLVMKRARFLLMSATLGKVDKFAEVLDALTGATTVIVRSNDRPVPLDFEYRETALHETVAALVSERKSPIYIVSFTQRGCAEVAQDLMSVDFCTKDEKKAIAAELAGFRFDSPYGKEVQRFLRHGIAVHHAGLLPKYRLLTEKLAQKGHLKIICGTDTLGVGVNIPIRTVLFTRLCKYDGEKTSILGVRDFLQIAGRAGRKGFDDRGSVVAQAPEHVIENLKLEAKAGNDPSKKRRIVKRKPPDFGYVHWDKGTFDRLVAGTPEPLVSRFQVTHGMLLQVLERERGGCKALVRLVRDSHETDTQKKQHRAHGLSLYRSLVDARVVEVVDHRLQVHVDLQENFSLDQTLSLYLVDTISRIETDTDTYALDVITLAESILEDPDAILRKQLDKLKGETVQRLKQEGVEYDERMAQLEKLTYPKPNALFLYETHEAFVKIHPWATENVRPKSIGREMVETLQGFSEYVKAYDLHRVEGVLLRYLSDLYKVLVQTVPSGLKTEELDDHTAWFGAMVRSVDSSLLDEWERMKDPLYALLPPEVRAEEALAPIDITRDERAFGVLVRNTTFRLARAIVERELATIADLIEPVDESGEAWTEKRLVERIEALWNAHRKIRFDAEARQTEHVRITKHPDRWEVVQVLLDDEGDNDWMVETRVDIERSRAESRAVIVLRSIGH